ncbi:leukocyte immunoglobulin-like receptor subfamily A member 1 isoform X2 [Cavia porcellus]|uniref:leukocyte immunoglobulin-like receptor subfamily A member 1 isoform X2 n=1 Tax=Cavia porcellus TaxID=10141 RepID=UPI00066191B2|nr:leukocyte immunoglobulin-like receptor subfamily A member 1 isoform X2 [Cavia porcellus]
MSPGLALLLGFMSALEQKIWVHSGSSSQPCIWAVPAAVVPQGGAVSIFCRVPPGVTLVRGFHREPVGEWHDRLPEGAREVMAFSLKKVTQTDAGIYSCEYWKQEIWSGHCEPLELVVTGIYMDKPSLTSHPGAQVASGVNVTLLCQSLYSYATYILCRGGGASFPQDCSRQDHDSFLFSPVSLDQAGTYTCYGCPSHSPQLWSLPSDPLQLSVTRSTAPIALVASVAAAFLLLVLLLLLLCLCRRRWCRAKCSAACDGNKVQMKHESASSFMQIQGKNKGDDLAHTEPEADRQRDTQVPASAEDTQEVTYAQLHSRKPGASMDSLLSGDPEAPSMQSCVYATLALS